MSLFVLAMQAGMWLGCVSFGYIADAWGLQAHHTVTFVVLPGVLLPIYGNLRTPSLLLVLGPLTAFFGTGYWWLWCGDRRSLSHRHSRDSRRRLLQRWPSCFRHRSISSWNLAATRGFGAAFGCWCGVPCRGSGVGWDSGPRARYRAVLTASPVIAFVVHGANHSCSSTSREHPPAPLVHRFCVEDVIWTITDGSFDRRFSDVQENLRTFHAHCPVLP